MSELVLHNHSNWRFHIVVVLVSVDRRQSKLGRLWHMLCRFEQIIACDARIRCDAKIRGNARQQYNLPDFLEYFPMVEVCFGGVEDVCLRKSFHLDLLGQINCETGLHDAD